MGNGVVFTVKLNPKAANYSCLNLETMLLLITISSPAIIACRQIPDEEKFDAQDLFY
jgi:hypothetical protein